MNLKSLSQLVLMSLVMLLANCKKEKTRWDIEMKAPLVESELNIGDLLFSTNIETKADSSISLVFQQTMLDIDINDELTLPDTTVEYGSSLQSLKLPDDSAQQTLSLGQIGGAAGMGATLNFLHGKFFPLPAMNNVSSPPIQMDYSTLFESMSIGTGTMEIIVINNLPVNIVNAKIELKNSASGEIIGSETFPLIASGSTVVKTIVLDGKEFSSQLEAEIVSFSTTSSGSAVLIDTASTITAKAVIRNLRPSSATAMWPDQDLIDTTRYLTIPKKDGIMLKDMDVKKGNIEMEVFSSLQDSMYVSYAVPNLEKNGQIFEATIVLPPAKPGGFSSLKTSFSLSGYKFTFNGYGVEKTVGKDINNNGIFPDQDTINAYLQNIKVRMQHSGEMKTISKSDTVYLKAKITELISERAVGFLGTDTIDIGPKTEDFPFFNGYFSGGLNMDLASIDLTINNGIGAEAIMEIVDINGTNSVTGTTVGLSGAAINKKHTLSKAKLLSSGTTPIEYSQTNISVNASNSTSANFISNLPNQIGYQIRTILNPFATPPTYTELLNKPEDYNFVYDGYGFNSHFNIEIPLSVVADSLILIDTIPFIFKEDVSESNEALFSLEVENSFGLDVGLQLILMDSLYNELDTLLSDGFMKRGTVDPATGKSIAATNSVVNFKVTKAILAQIANTKHVKAIANLHSYDVNDPKKVHFKIYASDGLKIKLIASSLFNMEF